MLRILTDGFTHLVPVPKATQRTPLTLDVPARVTCDDPIPPNSKVQLDGEPSICDPYKAPVQKTWRDTRRSQAGSSSRSTGSVDATDASECSAYGSGLERGSQLDPEKSVILVLEDMSQRRLKVSRSLDNWLGTETGFESTQSVTPKV